MFRENKEVKTEPIQYNNEIVDYYQGKAIVKDDIGEFYYVELPEEYAVMGECVKSEDLIPIESLNLIEQEAILNRRG